MVSRRSLAILVVTLSLVVTPILAACGATPTPTAIPTQAPTKAVATAGPTQPPPTQAPPTATKVPPTATPVPPTPTPKGPTVGGTLVLAAKIEPNTLDATKTTDMMQLAYIGGALLSLSPELKYTPYIAEGWKVSDDGLVWEFALKKGVKFHDGSSLTAKDFAWTFNRALDPNVPAGYSKSLLGSMKKAEVVDDYNLRVTLESAFAPFLYSLTLEYLAPVSQAAVEKGGEMYGRRSAIGAGPYVFKEWRTGDRMILERNPDFNWGPPWAHKGPWYIQTLEFRYIYEYSTIVAGLESGEIDHALDLDARDLPRLEGTGKINIFQVSAPGLQPGIWMDVSKPPFDDIRVRKAFNLAVDREALIKAVELGYAEPQYGPISKAVIGYSSGVEKIGYGFNLDQAKALMKEAGYTPGPDGILTKDGKPFKMKLTIDLEVPKYLKAGEVVQQQYKALGVELEIVTYDWTLWSSKCSKGCDLSLANITYSEADILYLLWHSSMLGTLNFSMLNDPKLDEMLDASRTTSDPEKRQLVLNDIQKYMVEQAYVVPLYAPTKLYGATKRIRGTIVGPLSVYFNDAYIQQ